MDGEHANVILNINKLLSLIFFTIIVFYITFFMFISHISKKIDRNYIPDNKEIFNEINNNIHYLLLELRKTKDTIEERKVPDIKRIEADLHQIQLSTNVLQQTIRPLSSWKKFLTGTTSATNSDVDGPAPIDQIVKLLEDISLKLDKS